MNDIRFALALALFATVFTLGRADHFESMPFKEYPEGFELRVLFPLAWMCCTNLSSLDRIAESEKVLQAFANGQNDQRRKCRFAPEISSENVPTSPLVTMMEGFGLEYYTKQAKDSSPASLLEAYQALKAAVFGSGVYDAGKPTVDMMLVETTPENEVYVGIPGIDRSDIHEMEVR